MVSVAEASSIVFRNLFSARIENIPFQQGINRMLAERITADRDFPPANRVSMDGIAILFRSWEQGRREFFIEGVQAAGSPPLRLKDPAHCLEVMTGAVLPEGTDTVIQYEHIDIRNNAAFVTRAEIINGQCIHRRGMDAGGGDILLEGGIILGPAEVALLAAVGKSHVNVFSFPRAAIVSSGDELVPVDHTPEPYQIRRSNAFAIQAAMKTLGWESTLYHLPDDKKAMTADLLQIAASVDVIILSGGVSKGKFDYVPAVLEDLGIKKLFHRVNQKPGKPFWFGKSQETTVFALPGNPVSTYMCFYRYIRPWVLKSLGIRHEFITAILAEDFSMPEPLSYFLQVNIKTEKGRLMAYPAPGGGSGDLANLKNVSGFLELPEAGSAFSKGDVFPYIPFRNVDQGSS